MTFWFCMDNKFQAEREIYDIVHGDACSHLHSRPPQKSRATSRRGNPRSSVVTWHARLHPKSSMSIAKKMSDVENGSYGSLLEASSQQEDQA